MENQEKQVENQQDNNDKVSKEYEKNFKKFVALLGGEANLKKVSVPNDSIGDVVKELLKERREEFIETFKQDTKDLLDKKIAFDKEVRAAEEQLKKTVTEKKKAFSEAMKKVFTMVEKIDQVEKSYYENLKGTSEVAPVTDTKEESK